MRRKHIYVPKKAGEFVDPKTKQTVVVLEKIGETAAEAMERVKKRHTLQR